MTTFTPVPAPPSRPSLVLLPGAADVVPEDQPPLPDEAADACPTLSDGVPDDAERAARAITVVLAEVLSGQRPVIQVRPALTPRAAALLDHLVRSGDARGMRLAGLRLQSPRDGVVEASARLASLQRSTALAYRLERRPRRWAIATLEAGLAHDGRRPARS